MQRRRKLWRVSSIHQGGRSHINAIRAENLRIQPINKPLIWLLFAYPENVSSPLTLTATPPCLRPSSAASRVDIIEKIGRLLVSPRA